MYNRNLLLLVCLVGALFCFPFYSFSASWPDPGFTILCSSSARAMLCTFLHCSLATGLGPRRPHQCAWCCVRALLAWRQNRTSSPSAHTCDVPCLCSRLNLPWPWIPNRSVPRASLSPIKKLGVVKEVAIWYGCGQACTGVTPLPDHTESKKVEEREDMVSQYSILVSLFSVDSYVYWK